MSSANFDLRNTSFSKKSFFQCLISRNARLCFCSLLGIAFLVLIAGLTNPANAKSLVNVSSQALGWTVNNSWAEAPILSISMVSANNGWLLGSRGTNLAYLAHWNGNTWVDSGTITHTQSILRGDLFMVSASEGWIVLGGPLASDPAASAIYRWNGSSWTHFATVTDPNATSLSAIDMASSTDGWATGAGKFWTNFYHWNGSAWQLTQTSPVATYVDNDLDMVSGTDGWTIGFTGKLMRWNSSSWITVTSPITTSLNAISMVSGGDGWIVGSGGTILRWNGSSWNGVTSPTTNNLNGIDMISANDGWAVGNNGEIIHWDGSNWSKVTSPINTSLNAVTMVSATEGWAGWDGLLHYGSIFNLFLPLIRR